jgi:hypothetical protein
MSFLAPAFAALTASSSFLPIAAGAGLGFLMSKSSVPAVPSITIPPAPEVPNAPLAPTSLADTAAMQRARSQRAIVAGSSRTVLTKPSDRDDTNIGLPTLPSSTSIQRTTLLGA